MSKKLTIFDFPQNTQLRLHKNRMPKPNTLTFPLSQTAMIFLDQANSKMLHRLHFSHHLMSCTARHDASKVPIKPLLDSALDFSTVKYMQLTKVVPRNSELRSNALACWQIASSDFFFERAASNVHFHRQEIREGLVSITLQNSMEHAKAETT